MRRDGRVRNAFFLSACAQLFLCFLAPSPLHAVPMLSFPRKRYKFNFASVLIDSACGAIALDVPVRELEDINDEELES